MPEAEILATLPQPLSSAQVVIILAIVLLTGLALAEKLMARE